MVISRRLFHLQTSYLVPRYNPIRRIQWPKCQWPWPKWVKNQRTVHISEAISHHIYYHSFLWLIWALPSCLCLRRAFSFNAIYLLILQFEYKMNEKVYLIFLYSFAIVWLCRKDELVSLLLYIFSNVVTVSNLQGSQRSFKTFKVLYFGKKY